MKRYLDFNATCPPTTAAIEAVSRAAVEAVGNPSSLHWAGRAARRIVDDARDKLAAHVGCEAGSIVFTSGGTEANNIAIHSALSGHSQGHIVSTAIEHPAILRPLQQLDQRDWRLQLVRPDADGVVQAEAMCAAIEAETKLVCMMLVNNESGVIHAVAEVAHYCRERGIPMLVDAVQALGKLSIHFQDIGADFMSLSAHKIGGPKGVGALLVRRGVKVTELAPGGGQERGRRSGTENVPGIAGFAAALGEIDFSSFAPIRDHFEQQLRMRLPEAVLIAASAHRTANTSLFLLPGMDGETLLMQLDLAGFAVASGSACSSGKREASHVLLAMGMSDMQARSSLRISFGPGNTTADADALVEALINSRQRLTNMAGRGA